jgi:hypothetical protein
MRRLLWSAWLVSLWFVAGALVAAEVAGLEAIPRPGMPRAGGGPPDQYTYVWAPGALESASMYTPSEVMVYRIVPVTPTKEMVCDLATRLGVSVSEEEYAALPEIAKEDALGPNIYAASFEQKNVHDQRLFECKDIELGDTGCFIYRHRGGEPRPGNALWQKDALPEGETREIAERFLAESGLLPEGCEFVGVLPDVAQNAKGFVVHGDLGASSRVLSRRAVYERRPAGVLLGSFGVSVNGAGDVYQVRQEVPRVEPIAPYPILSLEEARRTLRPGRQPSRLYGPATAAIDSVSLRYSGSWGGILQPLYQFAGTATGEFGRTETFRTGLPAVRPEYFLPDSGTAN